MAFVWADEIPPRVCGVPLHPGGGKGRSCTRTPEVGKERCWQHREAPHE